MQRLPEYPETSIGQKVPREGGTVSLRTLLIASMSAAALFASLNKYVDLSPIPPLNANAVDGPTEEEREQIRELVEECLEGVDANVVWAATVNFSNCSFPKGEQLHAVAKTMSHSDRLKLRAIARYIIEHPGEAEYIRELLRDTWILGVLLDSGHYGPESYEYIQEQSWIFIELEEANDRMLADAA